MYRNLRTTWRRSDLIEIAEPGDSDRPTPRAIRERLVTIRRQAGIKSTIKSAGSKVKPQVGRSQAQTQENLSVKDESGRTDTPASQIPSRKLNFIRSSFSTPFNSNEKKRNSNSGSIKRKSRRRDFSDEDEAISTGESSSDSDVAATASTRSSKRRRTTNPKYDLKDIQTSTDEENQVSADSDGGYDPVADKEKKEAKRDKRDIVRKAKVHEEDDVAEEA